MIQVKVSKKRDPSKKSLLRLVRIKLKNRKRPVVVRLSDYENADELLNFFNDLKARTQTN